MPRSLDRFSSLCSKAPPRSSKNALTCLKRSALLRQQTGDVRGEAGVLRDMAAVYDSLDDADRARAALREAAQKDALLQDRAPV